MTNNKQKVIFYVDGFNFYFGLKSAAWKKYLWLDMVKFCSQFLRPHQELVEVNYFTSIPDNKDGQQDRQDLFLSANRQSPQFILHLGKFMSKNKKCFKCKNKIVSYEEKETDVRIATEMIRNVVGSRCDISILISADSDLIPPINFIRDYDAKHKIFLFFPPKRFSHNLRDMADNFIKLDNHEPKFVASVFPDEIPLPNTYVLKRPPNWV